MTDTKRINKIIYLLAVIVSVFTLSIYVPRWNAYAQDKAEQRKINQQILDLQLELNDLQAERDILDSDKLDYLWQIELMSWYVADIRQTQDELHNRADEIRKEIDILKWDASMNDELINCYQWTGDLYNDCLDAIISVGLMKSRQAQ